MSQHAWFEFFMKVIRQFFHLLEMIGFGLSRQPAQLEVIPNMAKFNFFIWPKTKSQSSLTKMEEWGCSLAATNVLEKSRSVINEIVIRSFKSLLKSVNQGVNCKFLTMYILDMPTQGGNILHTKWPMKTWRVLKTLKKVKNSDFRNSLADLWMTLFSKIHQYPTFVFCAIEIVVVAAVFRVRWECASYAFCVNHSRGSWWVVVLQDLSMNSKVTVRCRIKSWDD